jgi:hypothetical protein
LFKLALQ